MTREPSMVRFPSMLTSLLNEVEFPEPEEVILETLIRLQLEQSIEPLVDFKIRFPDASIILFSKERYDIYYNIIR